MIPLLIGENNPQSLAKGHELYPLPDGCAGNRLWRMLNEAHQRKHKKQLLPSKYLAGFERRNLVVAKSFDPRTAKASAGVISEELWGSGRTVVLLGRNVQRAFGIPPAEPFSDYLNGGVKWWRVPHPSGRNLWFNEQSNRATVGDFLLRIYEEGQK